MTVVRGVKFCLKMNKLMKVEGKNSEILQKNIKN